MTVDLLMPGIFWNGLVRLSNVFSEIKKKTLKLGQCLSLLSVASMQLVAQKKSNLCFSFLLIPELNLVLLVRGVVWRSVFGVHGSQ